ncbi:MAG: hypothetical protein PHQ03_03770 [Methylococcales bacterium]|nr:hypothetical protein [Methylococcales bacterium]
MPHSKTAQLLISGGDERLDLSANGFNKYGVKPMPDDEILAFSSSTATPISSGSFDIANHLRIRLEQENFSANILYQEMNRQKAQWRELIGLEKETQIIFSPSGTNLHGLVANQVADNSLIIMVQGSETGSGVENALKQNSSVEIESVALRSSDGSPRPISQIDSNIISLTQQAMLKQKNVLLILVDQTKTGMIAPSVNCAIALKKQFKNRLDVLVDACQFRLCNATLKMYLQQNFMLALTGSKFLAAPSFSGILVVPESISVAVQNEKITAGLLLRMEIALHQYHAFCALNDEQIQTVIRDFLTCVKNYLNNSPYFELLENVTMERENLTWDSLPTIFSFLLLRDKQPLSIAQTREIYQQLPLQNPRCQLGQPVMLSEEKSALRLCLSAPLIVQAAQSESHRLACIEKALRVLATLERII